MKYLLHAIVLLSIFVLAGCSTMVITHGELIQPTYKYSEKIGVYSRTEGRHITNIGTRKMPYLAWIPVGAIQSQVPINHQVMNDIKSVLERTGYEVSMAKHSELRTQPTINCIIHRFGFKNYPMFFPVCVWSGRIVLEVQLLSCNGQVFWDKEFEAGGMGGGLASYDKAINKATTDILNDMVEAFSNEEFHQALLSAGQAGAVPLVQKSKYQHDEE